MNVNFDSLKDLLILSEEKLFTPVTQQKIHEFRDLEEGWAFGSGIKFTDQVIEDAIAIHSLINNNGFLETGAFPGESGEILITIYEGCLYSEIFVYENKVYDFIIESDDEEILRKEEISSDILIKELEEFRKKVICNNLSELSTQGISIKRNEDTRAQPLRTQAKEAEFQLSKKAASSKRPGVYVSISASSMERSQEPQSSFGNSLYQYCPNHA